MKWFEIIEGIKNDLLSRNLATPYRRINELDNLEGIFKKHFRGFLENPQKMFGITDKESFKNEVAKHKSNGKLNGAESSLINEIYKKIKL